MLLNILLAAASAFPAQGNVSELADTIRLEEVEVSAVKQGMSVTEMPAAASVIGQIEAEKLNINSLKGISAVVPNFFMPDYGSRITSSIYVRGLGARMDQPAVGLIVDNVPVLNKDAYDFDIADIVKMEMIRGPQSTLYGRNTMCGLINISTLSPLNYRGLRVLAEYGRGNSMRFSAGYYTKVGTSAGIAAIAQYNGTDGFYRNLYNGKKTGRERQWSGRVKFDWNPSGNFILQNVLSAGNLNQSGYPYEYLGKANGTPTDRPTGVISYNDTCFYRRFTLMDGLTTKSRLGQIELVTVTSLQYIDDNMTLDQDFLPDSYFTLTQKKHDWSVTQDVVAKGKGGEKYSWLGGAFAFYKNTDMHAPVTFKDTGIKELIENHRNDSNPDYPIEWESRSFPLHSDFTMPTVGVALYHQSEINLDRFNITLGLRLDYEHASLNFNSRCNTGYEIYSRTASGALLPYRHVDIDIDETGHLTKHFLELLPKLAVTYSLNDEGGSYLYGSIAKGYKAGGFNTQMFSDVLQQRLMSVMGIGASYNVNDIVGYKPEKSWNYEAGIRVKLPKVNLEGELSLFYIDCMDQQLTMFPDGITTGRMMTNAGKTRSYGAEISATYRMPAPRLMFHLSYGYTNARFRKFFNGINDFKGKHIPYAPSNTFFAQVGWNIDTHSPLIDNIELDANVNANGPIWWNEENTLHQKFYACLGASVTLHKDDFALQFWGENITDTKFSTFYFVSMGNSFVQRAKPGRFGVTLRASFSL